MYEERFMARAIELSRRALTEVGCEPFGAIVVKDGQIIGEGINRAAALNDPTAHGEVEAIRDACRRLGSRDLSGCDLYTSCEPCTLCTATIHVTGIARLFYAVALEESWEALKHLPQTKRRYTMTAWELRSQCGLPVHERRMPAERHGKDAALPVIRDWAGLIDGKP